MSVPARFHGALSCRDPFDHWIIDRFITPERAAAVAAEFPPPDDTRWHTFTGPLEHGKQEGAAAIAGPYVAGLHELFAAPQFVSDLQRLVVEFTDIDDLIADPARVGGGIHQSGPGARLGLHVDYSIHPQRPGLVRALNLILFLDDGPDLCDDGGWFELHCEQLIGPPTYKRIRPTAGMLVIFPCDSAAFHGHPVPLAADAGLRRSVPAYYFRPLNPGEQIEAHSTRFLET